MSSRDRESFRLIKGWTQFSVCPVWGHIVAACLFQPCDIKLIGKSCWSCGLCWSESVWGLSWQWDWVQVTLGATVLLFHGPIGTQISNVFSCHSRCHISLSHMVKGEDQGNRNMSQWQQERRRPWLPAVTADAITCQQERLSCCRRVDGPACPRSLLISCFQYERARWF